MSEDVPWQIRRRQWPCATSSRSGTARQHRWTAAIDRRGRAPAGPPDRSSCRRAPGLEHPSKAGSPAPSDTAHPKEHTMT